MNNCSFKGKSNCITMFLFMSEDELTFVNNYCITALPLKINKIKIQIISRFFETNWAILMAYTYIIHR